MKVCQVDGCNYPVWGKGYCRGHQWRRDDLKRPKRKHDSIKQKLIKQQKEKNAEFLEHIRQTRILRCFECGEPIAFLTWGNIHHLIEKHYQDRYSVDIWYNDENVVVVCMDHHGQAHSNIDKVPLIHQATIEITLRYEQYRIH